MQTLKFNLSVQSYFATPLHGDTLFGQLCWAVLRSFGEQRLQSLLQNYADAPFAVVSDAFPAGYLPRPQVPQALLAVGEMDPQKRKAFKRKQWIPVAAAGAPVSEWMAQAKTDAELLKQAQLAVKPTTSSRRQETDTEQSECVTGALWTASQQMHNSINRMTGTTGEAGFAPYGVQTWWSAEGLSWDVYVTLDEQQLSADELHELMVQIGAFGYGKDASIGAGKFDVNVMELANLPHHAQANAVLTLAASAPQGLALKPEGCFYQPFTRYGRHGDWAVLVNPYKTPVLLAKAAAVLMPQQMDDKQYIGQGLGGNGELSRTISSTVHQGYAPILRVAITV